MISFYVFLFLIVLTFHFTESFTWQTSFYRRNQHGQQTIINPHCINPNCNIKNGNNFINARGFTNAGDGISNRLQLSRSCKTKLRFVTDVNVLTELSEITIQQQQQICDLTTTSCNNLYPFFFSISDVMGISSSSNSFSNVDKDSAEAIAGPFFGLSLFPYLLFLYFLSRPQNETPKGVVIGFAACLLFVFLTIPAAIFAKIIYGVSLADSDWLHGSAESMLTITNLVTVIPFRQALSIKQLQQNQNDVNIEMPKSATEYGPTLYLLTTLTGLALISAIIPGVNHPEVHTLYLNGFMDLPSNILEPYGARIEPENALSIATWIIHVSSLVEFLIAMGFCWRWADITGNPKWKGLTWGLLPLHSSGITACVSHLFYNNIALLVPFQAILTCIGNTTAAWAAYRIAVSNGWKLQLPDFLEKYNNLVLPLDPIDSETKLTEQANRVQEERKSLIGFEDLGEALANDNDYSFLFKLFAGCAMASYLIKYGELFLAFPFGDENMLLLGFTFIMIPSALNAYKWYRRSQDPTFEGWF